MGDVDPRTCPTCVNRVKHEEPSKVTFDLIFIYFDSWLCRQNLTPYLRGTARWRTMEILITSQASVPKFTSLIRNSLSALFHWIAPFWILHFILLPWQPSLSESPTSLIPFPLSFFTFLAVTFIFLSSRLIPLLFLALSLWLSVFHSSGSPPFFLFLTTVICGTDLCSVFFTTVCNKIFMLHSKHLHHIEF